MIVFVLGLLMLVVTVNCGKYTVTEEAWFDFEVKDQYGPGKDYNGRITIALFGETVPATVKNFAAITKGFTKGDEKLSYKNSKVHRIVKDFVIQMGDITKGDGTGGTSIYGHAFIDENFKLKNRGAGWVGMANRGKKDTNDSQFYILLTKADWLDKKYVVFGKVIRGFKVLDVLGNLKIDFRTATPDKEVTIVDCGLNRLNKKYDIPENKLDISEDL